MLLQVIRDSQNETKTDSGEVLVVKCNVPQEVDLSMDENLSGLPGDVVTLSSAHLGSKEGRPFKIPLKVYVSIFGANRASLPRSVTNVHVSVDGPEFIHVFPKSTVIEKLSTTSTTPLLLQFTCYATKATLPVSLQASINASYTCSNGEPRSLTRPISLPLVLACRLKGASKSAAYKVTLDTPLDAIPLTDLFDDFLLASQECGVDVSDTLGKAATQAMGFGFWHDGSTVSILVSKQAGRYRIQSDNFPSLALVSNELERRLLKSFGNIQMQKSGESLPPLVSVSEPLPLDVFFIILAEHFNARAEINNLLAQLNDLAHQFRMIQKRLLVRYKDRNPSALGGLGTLLHESYERIIEMGDRIETKRIALRHRSIRLEGAALLLTQLISLKYSLSPNERSLLEAALAPELRDGSDIGQGWEETVLACSTYLLKTSLSRGGKESSVLLNIALDMPEDIERLKANIMLIVDKLDRGERMSRLPHTS